MIKKKQQKRKLSKTNPVSRRSASSCKCPSLSCFLLFAVSLKGINIRLSVCRLCVLCAEWGWGINTRTGNFILQSWSFLRVAQLINSTMYIDKFQDTPARIPTQGRYLTYKALRRSPLIPDMSRPELPASAWTCFFTSTFQSFSDLVANFISRKKACLTMHTLASVDLAMTHLESQNFGVQLFICWKKEHENTNKQTPTLSDGCGHPKWHWGNKQKFGSGSCERCKHHWLGCKERWGNTAMCMCQ